MSNFPPETPVKEHGGSRLEIFNDDEDDDNSSASASSISTDENVAGHDGSLVLNPLAWTKSGSAGSAAEHACSNNIDGLKLIPKRSMLFGAGAQEEEEEEAAAEQSSAVGQPTNSAFRSDDHPAQQPSSSSISMPRSTSMNQMVNAGFDSSSMIALDDDDDLCRGGAEDDDASSDAEMSGPSKLRRVGSVTDRLNPSHRVVASSVKGPSAPLNHRKAENVAASQALPTRASSTAHFSTATFGGGPQPRLSSRSIAASDFHSNAPEPFQIRSRILHRRSVSDEFYEPSPAGRSKRRQSHGKSSRPTDEAEIAIHFVAQPQLNPFLTPDRAFPSAVFSSAAPTFGAHRRLSASDLPHSAQDVSPPTASAPPPSQFVAPSTPALHGGDARHRDSTSPQGADDVMDSLDPAVTLFAQPKPQRRASFNLTSAPLSTPATAHSSSSSSSIVRLDMPPPSAPAPHNQLTQYTDESPATAGGVSASNFSTSSASATPSAPLSSYRQQQQQMSAMKSTRTPSLSSSSAYNAHSFDDGVPRSAPPKLWPPANTLYGAMFAEEELIGEGSFGRVYRCRHRLDGCLYAVKISKKKLRRIKSDGHRSSQLLNEVHALSSVRNTQHIVRYYNAWQEQSHIYIQMEFCEGGNLEQHWRSCGAHIWTEPLVLNILRQMTLALHELHSSNMVHLDVKPANIYVSHSPYRSHTLPLKSNSDAMSTADNDEQIAPCGDEDSAMSASGTRPSSIFANPLARVAALSGTHLPGVHSAPSTSARPSSGAATAHDETLSPPQPAVARPSLMACSFKLGDLGLIARFNDDSDMEGDCRYLPRELLQEEHVDKRKCDMFSLGIAMYELARGRPLPPNGDEWTAIRDGNPSMIDMNRFSESFWSLLSSMMHPDPVQRPSTAEMLKHALLLSPAERELARLRREIARLSRGKGEIEVAPPSSQPERAVEPPLLDKENVVSGGLPKQFPYSSAAASPAVFSFSSAASRANSRLGEGAKGNVIASPRTPPPAVVAGYFPPGSSAAPGPGASNPLITPFSVASAAAAETAVAGSASRRKQQRIVTARQTRSSTRLSQAALRGSYIGQGPAGSGGGTAPAPVKRKNSAYLKSLAENEADSDRSSISSSSRSVGSFECKKLNERRDCHVHLSDDDEDVATVGSATNRINTYKQPRPERPLKHSSSSGQLQFEMEEAQAPPPHPLLKEIQSSFGRGNAQGRHTLKSIDADEQKRQQQLLSSSIEQLRLSPCRKSKSSKIKKTRTAFW